MAVPQDHLLERVIKFAANGKIENLKEFSRSLDNALNIYENQNPLRYAAVKGEMLLVDIFSDKATDSELAIAWVIADNHAHADVAQLLHARSGHDIDHLYRNSKILLNLQDQQALGELLVNTVINNQDEIFDKTIVKVTDQRYLEQALVQAYLRQDEH